MAVFDNVPIANGKRTDSERIANGRGSTFAHILTAWRLHNLRIFKKKIKDTYLPPPQPSPTGPARPTGVLADLPRRLENTNDKRTQPNPNEPTR